MNYIQGIAVWFLYKTWTQEEIFALKNGAEIEVVRETEKARNIKVITDFGTFYKWVPKKCLSI